MSHVLIVDDEPTICWGFKEFLTDEGHEISVAASAEDAFQAVETNIPDAIVLDVRLPGMDGLTAIEHLRKRIGDVPIIVITAFGNLETAVRAIDQGAFEYLTKPFDLDRAAEIVHRALQRKIVADDGPPRHIPEDGSDQIIGSSPAMQAVFKQIALAATSDVPVLITGETGTGKELVAKAIHRYSRRSTGPYLPVCLAALSSTVIESELFGHVKGAYTGADVDRKGLLELADGGTVLLDEIGDVPLPFQVKLLRAIEHHEVSPVGDTQPRRTDFRVLAATNRSIPDLVSAGRFREDLYYRLGVFHIEVPPLRNRTADILALVDFFLRHLHADQREKRFTHSALRELGLRPWYGNVRELKNAVEHATTVARGVHIEADHLPPPMYPGNADVISVVERLKVLTTTWLHERMAEQTHEVESRKLFEDYLKVVEPALLKAAFDLCHGNRSSMARILGMHRTTLRQKQRQYGIAKTKHG